ncbi:MAG: hypothetical protein IJ109_07825, partial [Firmicutes bacterium]|nr:hypothetical protein [Bacillota bacterium]
PDPLILNKCHILVYPIYYHLFGRVSRIIKTFPQPLQNPGNAGLRLQHAQVITVLLSADFEDTKYGFLREAFFDSGENVFTLLLFTAFIKGILFDYLTQITHLIDLLIHLFRDSQSVLLLQNVSFRFRVGVRKEQDQNGKEKAECFSSL